jgi:DNA-binding winged helix-turn-helix (wHTH) protein
MLVALVERRDRVVGKHELMDLVWPKLVVEENNLQAQVVALRKLLGPAAIATVPGRGYRLALAVEAVTAPPSVAVSSEQHASAAVTGSRSPWRPLARRSPMSDRPGRGNPPPSPRAPPRRTGTTCRAAWRR